jgi:hypothetical protein
LRTARVGADGLSALAVGRKILQGHLVEEHGHWVQVAGEGVGADAQGFKGDRADAGEGVHHQGRAIGMGGRHQPAGGLSRSFGLAEFSQAAKWAMKSKSAFRKARGSERSRPVKGLKASRASRRNASGQFGSAGSGRSVAISTARQAARG